MREAYSVLGLVPRRVRLEWRAARRAMHVAFEAGRLSSTGSCVQLERALCDEREFHICYLIGCSNQREEESENWSKASSDIKPSSYRVSQRQPIFGRCAKSIFE